jgi:hypothetical protein
MANWKKVIVSGSTANLAALQVDNLTSGEVVIGGGSSNLSTTAINGTGNIVATTGASGLVHSGSFSGSFEGTFTGTTNLPELTKGAGISAFTYDGAAAATVAVSGASSLNTNTVTKWTGDAFANTNITDNGSVVDINSNTVISGSLTVTGNVISTGSFKIQPDVSDARYLEVYNTAGQDTHITASSGWLFLGDDTTYVKVDNYSTNNLIELKADNGFVISGSTTITGSLISTRGVNAVGGFTGSLLGTATSASMASYVAGTNVDGAVGSAATASYIAGANVVGAVANSDRLGGVGAASYALNTALTGFATTGSNTFVGNQSVTGDVYITGTLTANTYIVSSSLTNMTVAYASGSTAFGNSSDDTHVFTGSLSILGTINAGTGGITGSFKGDGSGLTGVTATAIFPTTAKSDIASSDQFYINDGANKYITYGDLLTDLAGTNLAVEGTDSLALNTTVAGLTSVTSTTLSGSYIEAQTYTNIGNISKTFAYTGIFSAGENTFISVDPNAYPHNAIFVKYVLWRTAATPYADMRAGTIMIVRDLAGSNYNIAESTTQDIGDTSLIDFTVSIAGSTSLVMDTTAYGASVTIKYEYTRI